MHTRPAKILLVLLLSFFSNFSFAQSPEKLLGKPLTSSSISEFMKSFKNDKPVESFLPYLRILKLDYLQSGLSMEYNTDIALSKISLYDSGYTYQRYSGNFPFNLKWGLSINQVQDKTG